MAEIALEKAKLEKSSKLDFLENSLAAHKESLKEFELDFKEITEDININAFFDGVELYQQPKQYPEFFEKGSHLTQKMRVAQPVVTSNKLEQLGGASKITKILGVYSIDELIIFFQTLRLSLDTEPHAFQQGIALCISSINHAITVGYDLKKQWTFTDAGASSPSFGTNQFKSDKEIAEKVFSAFSNTHGTLIINTELYTSKEYASELWKYLAIWKQDTLWKKIHQITPTKAGAMGTSGDGHIYHLLNLAIEVEDIELVKQILDTSDPIALFSMLHLAGRFNPLIHSTIMENSAISMLLLEKGADPNVSYNNKTPLSLAVIFENSDIINSLLKYGAYPDAPSVSTDKLAIKNLLDDAKLKQLLEMKQRISEYAHNGDPLTIQTQALDKLRKMATETTEVYLLEPELNAFAKLNAFEKNIKLS
ncbi:MAG: hypothetical protein P4M14_07015 [Gammaproteobacteria bacterium]|nr:hypothetical protein [Gammaproteobacteria bacterium]